MADHLKTPFGQSVDRWMSRKVADGNAQHGWSLPAVVTDVSALPFVTVNFEVVGVYTLPPRKVPLLGAEYLRLPIRAGCKGMVIAADAYLGGVTGLGTGTADLSTPPNLTALAFVPLSSTAFLTLDVARAWLYSTSNALLSVGDDGVSITGAHADLSVGRDLVVAHDATVTHSLKVSSAPTGTFTSADGKTITVTNGIVTGITP